MMENNLGKVHSIETFGTVDGPGIRFVIFMQGCPLKCLYCHNRDTWEVNAGNLTKVEDLVSEIKRYLPYINSSGGGVTVSGGEPLLQANFVTSLFKELHKINIHTCLDTAGSLPINDSIEELLKYTDLVLLDIKHIDDEKAKVLTEEQIINFEEDIKNGKKVDIKKYVLYEDKDYSNKVSSDIYKISLKLETAVDSAIKMVFNGAGSLVSE